MDTVLLFALPLVGGLIFCSTWNFTRWRVAREDGHRLYFRAVLFGAILFAFVASVNSLIENYSPCYSSVITFVKSHIEPMAKDKNSAAAVADLTIICFLTMLAGWPLALLLNLGFKRNYWLRQAIKKDALEAFLLDAADGDISIAITMDDRKIYVGYVVSGFDPEKWLRLFEQLSPIYKWIPGGLRLMSRGASKISSYAACFICGKAAQYFSYGVSRSRLECGRCVLYQPR